MTRGEQMWQAVEKEHGELSVREAFVTLTAMEWSDKTMIEKVTQWLYNHLTTEYHGAVLKIVAKEKGLMPVEFVERFKKAMLEEE